MARHSNGPRHEGAGGGKQQQQQKEKSVTEQKTGFRLASASKTAFLPDDEVAATLGWRIFMFLFWHGNQWFHRISWEGYELDQNTGYLTVYMHTTHNHDIPFVILATYRRTHKVTRGLVHRTVMALLPFLSHLGMVPGYRDTAKQLLQDGYWVGVVPGGAEEAMRGHENAYTLDWLSTRKGFAKVAIQAGVSVVPVFLENGDEMRFNPFFWLWNSLALSVPYNMVVNAKIPVLSALIKFLAEFVWFWFAVLFSFPVPSKVTVHNGTPIEVTSDSSIEDVVKKTREGLQGLIDKWQPARRKDYGRAFRQWREDRIKENYGPKQVTLQSNARKRA